MMKLKCLKGIGRMHNKTLKSILVVAATLAASVLFGIIGVSKRYSAIMPSGAPSGVRLGVVLLVIGLLASVGTAVFILRYFIFFTRMQVLDTNGVPITDNSRIAIGSARVRPIVVASCAALVSMISIGIGIGMLLDPVRLYVLYICSIALALFALAVVLFLFSVIRHKIRRRFAWIATGIFLGLSLLVFSRALPSLHDLYVTHGQLTAVTGTVSRTSSYAGMLAGPGKTSVTIKGTSGETITLHYGSDASELLVGKRYTFYYLPQSKFVRKVKPVDSQPY